MQTTRFRAVGFAVLFLGPLVVGACENAPVARDAGAGDAAAGDDGGGDAGAAPAVARFSPSAGTAPMAFGDVPFPHDLYLGSDGHVSLANLPIETAPSAGLTALLERVRSETGFCVTCGAHFYVDGDVDPSSVPSTVPASATAAMVFADVDPASPERGRLFPLELQWRGSAHLLSVRPPLGITLHRSRRYAIALTSHVRGMDGAPLAASEAFLAARDGTSSTDPGVLRAQGILAPALAELATAGVDVSRIVSCAVFTTSDPLSASLALRSTVRAGPRPVAAVDVVYPTTAMSLDLLMGVPAGPGFGVDLPEVGGVVGERGYPHTTTARVIVGSFENVRVIEGTGTELGLPSRDAMGHPVSTGSERIPFLLVIPRGADVTSLPVVIAAHGSPRTMQDALALADTFGASGIAVLGYDAIQHGGRAPSAVDALTARGAAGQDGIFEHDRVSVQSHLFAAQGTPSGFAGALVYIEGSYAQNLADALAMVRFAVEGDLSAVAASDPSLAGLAFDPDAIFFLGNSFGTFAGAPLLALEPDLDAVMLNVPGGSIAQFVVGAARTRSLVDTTVFPLWGMRGRFDEVTRRAAFEPMLDILGWIFSPFDGHALSPYVYRDPGVAGPRPDLLLQHAELDDFLPIWGAESMVASMGVERLGPFDFVDGVPAAAHPITGNVMTPSGPVTAVAHLYEGAAHGMLGWAETEVAFQAPIIPPFVPLDPPRLVTNPTEALHLELRAFVTSRLMAGHARLE